MTSAAPQGWCRWKALPLSRTVPQADCPGRRDLVARSPIALAALEASHVVGFVRALTDGVSNGYISVLVVDEAFRNRGIGSVLVRAAMGTHPAMTWVLRPQHAGLFRFYGKLGFSVSEVAMERVRQVQTR